MSNQPRVAFFADSFHEVNGAALTSRRLEAFARRRGYELLSVHCGPRAFRQKTGSVLTLQLRRGPFAVAVDRDLKFDPLLFRWRNEVLAALREFRPDVIHVTSPGDVGVLGAWAAHTLQIPLVASWHTNLHEFAARRLEKVLSFLPRGGGARIAAAAESWILGKVLWFYSLAAVALAPNHELATMIGARTGKPVFLMARGIDTAQFSPSRRDRADGPFTLGFVGRVTPEKGVRLLVKLEQQLLASNVGPFRLLIVGAGSEVPWLTKRLRTATFAGVLTGDALARAYANMDLFVFPSRTDTFGNVVLEAMASGVPAVVTAEGGPKYLVQKGVTGFVAETEDEFCRAAMLLMEDPELLRRMRTAAVEHARQYSWDRVFEAEVYEAYRICLAGAPADAARRRRSSGLLAVS